MSSSGRPPLPIGTWGAVRVEATATGRFRARARFRDFDGTTREIERTGTTKGAARNALTSALTERTAPAGDDITASTRLAVVAEVWRAENADDWAINTARRYGDVLADHVIPALGNLTVREATVTRLDRFLKTITAEVGGPTAKLCRSVLSGVMGLAVRHGAAATNPVREVAGITVVHKEVRALTLDEVAVLRAATQAWQEGRPIRPTDEPQKPRRGRMPSPDTLDIIDVLLATGARIGEVLALTWPAVELEPGDEAVTITGTVVWEDQETGPRKLIRQDHPKTASSWRRLELPWFAADTLLRRRVMAPDGNPGGLVFPSSVGTLRDPNNVRATWRKIREAAGFGWVTPHTMRRTVATLLDASEGLREAADQLGHVSTDITERHYIQKSHRGPAVRAALGAMVQDPRSISEG